MLWFILVMLNMVAGVTSSIYIVSIFQGSTMEVPPISTDNHWGFPRMGVPPVIIHVSIIFHNKNHPYFGDPYFGDLRIPKICYTHGALDSGLAQRACYSML